MNGIAHSIAPMKTSSIVLSVFSLAQLPAFTQEACVALLRHGLRDTIRRTQTNDSALSSTSSLCSAYQSYKNGNMGANASISIPGLSGLGANGGLSLTQIEQLGSNMCDNKTFDTSDAARIATLSDTINPDAVKAFTDCVKYSQRGIAKHGRPPASGGVAVEV